MTTTEALPEPTQRDNTEHGVDYYTAAQRTDYAARVSAAKDAEIERLRADAARWVWWAEAVASHDLNSIEEAFKDVPHDQPTSKQALDAAVDAALKDSK